MDEKELSGDLNKRRFEGNTCMALGAGVGALGAASAALTGALCPLCIFIAPGLIGYGAFRRWRKPVIRQEESTDKK